MGREVVLGLGGCLDYEITWDGAVMEALVVRYGIRPDEVSTSVPVRSERDLVCSILGFVRDGVGGERFVATSDVVEAFAARFTRRITLGGTCVRAAIAMSRLGLSSTVHLVSIDDHVRRLLPAQVSYLCSATEDSTDPHLIVQFPAGARVLVGEAELLAPQANRLIYVNDRPNRELPLSPHLGATLSTAGVFLVSGFNSMQDPGLLDGRLQELRTHMSRLPAGAVVVYEDAGYHVPSFSRRVWESIFDLVDVHGMNEDEMQVYLGRPVELLDAGAMAAALEDLHTLMPGGTLVVHSRYWALALGSKAQAYRAALESGTAMAGARYLHGDVMSEADYRAVSGNPRHPGGREFAVALEARLPDQVCCVPALVLSSPAPTTVGLGDAFVGGFIAALAL